MADKCVGCGCTICDCEQCNAERGEGPSICADCAMEKQLAKRLPSAAQARVLDAIVTCRFAPMSMRHDIQGCANNGWLEIKPGHTSVAITAAGRNALERYREKHAQ